jgi:hypothetical protein
MAAEACVERHFRAIAERRATAASLACQLFRAERGRWPERMEELVPAFLPHVPTDPFFDDGRWIVYVMLRGALPDGGDRPVLVWGEQRLDYGPPPWPCYGWYRDRRRQPSSDNRQYRDVARFVPPPEALKALLEEDAEALRDIERAIKSAEAVDDDPEEADEPRDEEKPDDQPQ